MTLLDRESLLDHLEADSASYAALLAGADQAAFAAPVPSCPGWTLASLTTHLGQTQRWARAALDQPQDTPPDAALLEDGPDDPAAARDWLAAGTAELLRALRAVDPATPVWAFGPRESRTAGFWVRRQAHEVAVHLWDAEAALGEPDPLDAALAADGVDEVVTLFVPRQVHRGTLRLPEDRAVGLVAADTGDSWVLGSGEPVAIVTADAEDLLLLLWKRVGFGADGAAGLAGVATVTGDAEAATAVLALPLTP